MAEQFRDTARAARSLSSPLPAGKRDSLAAAAGASAADATRKAGGSESMQAAAARSAEESVRSAAQAHASEEGTTTPPSSPSGAPSGDQSRAREAKTEAASADYERACEAEAAQDWRHSFGGEQRHALPTEHTGLQREFGRD